ELNAAQSETEAAGLQDQLDSLFEPIVAAAPLPDVGVSTRERTKPEVVGFPALVKVVANGTVANTVLMVNNAALQALARQYKDNKTIPCVRIYRDDVMVART